MRSRHGLAGLRRIGELRIPSHDLHNLFHCRPPPRFVGKNTLPDMALRLCSESGADQTTSNRTSRAGRGRPVASSHVGTLSAADSVGGRTFPKASQTIRERQKRGQEAPNRPRARRRSFREGETLNRDGSSSCACRATGPPSSPARTTRRRPGTPPATQSTPATRTPRPGRPRCPGRR